MAKQEELVRKISDTVKAIYPDADLILFGSRARGTSRKNSDYDLLILLNQKEVKRADERRVKYPLYEIEFESGQIISPVVLSKTDWETRHRITPFYERVMEEGIRL